MLGGADAPDTSTQPLGIDRVRIHPDRSHLDSALIPGLQWDVARMLLKHSGLPGGCPRPRVVLA